MRSLTEVAGTDGFTMSTLGVVATRVTGAKSLMGSYGIFLYKLWLMPCVDTVPMRIV